MNYCQMVSLWLALAIWGWCHGQCDNFLPGPQSATLLANVLLDGEVADANDVLFAYAENGNCVGSAPMVLEQGLAFVNLTLYGDDPTTDINDGLGEGASFFLAIFDASTEQILWLNEGAAAGSWTNMNGAPLPGWSNPYSILEFVSAEPYPRTSMAPVLSK